jgi:tRNA G18 (ribose-2'-O)-methylase SpoU
MRVISVATAEDPRIAEYAAVRDRDLAGREGTFVVEGKVALRVLVDRGAYPIRSVLLAERRVEAVSDLLARLGTDVPVYVASQATMDAIVGFPIHRGVLAMAERTPVPCADDLLQAIGPGARLVVGLVGVVNHDNVGGVFRNAAAFGVVAALLDAVTCDPLYRKAIRVSSGASLFVPFARSSSEHALVDALARAGFEIWGLSPKAGADVREIVPGGRTALLVGAEGDGLSAEVLARVRAVRIPMTAGFDSLNVAVASGIAMFQARAT